MLALLHLGDKYDVQPLLAKCDKRLFSKINLRNCVEFHQAVTVYERKELMLKIEIYIARLGYIYFQ